MSQIEAQRRVLSGMRPTGRLHLGHYHGVLRNWTRLQHEYECLFFVADWHALTTHYEEPEVIGENVWQMVLDWLAAGVNPGSATLFIQSRVPEHAELHLLLSMITPLSWVERSPSYKDMVAGTGDRELATYGFLGYPVLQSSDILIYRAGNVPVGADQAPHVEITREIARRFNHIFGRGPGFEKSVENAIEKLGAKNAKLYEEQRRNYRQHGDQESLEKARAMLQGLQNITLGDRDRLFGYLEGSGKVILPEPRVLLTETPMMPGLDGRKMSKSYDNAIPMREEPEVVSDKIRTMTTDPARVRRTDPGDPDVCPVFQLHAVYSDEDTRAWVRQGCTSAGIGCIDCKKPLIDKVLEEQQMFMERARPYEEDPELVKSIVAEGCERARGIARATMEEVRSAMGLGYR